MTDAPPPSIPPRPSSSSGRNGRRTVSSRVVPVEVAPEDVRVPEAAPARDWVAAPQTGFADPVAEAPTVFGSPDVGRGRDSARAAPVVDPHLVAERAIPHAAEPAPAVASTWAAEPWAAAPAADAERASASTEYPQGEYEDDDAPTPLAAAVEKTTVWLRKAGSATTTRVSSAYASITRPAPEEVTMTSTNAAPAPLGAVDPNTSWSGGGTSRPITPGARPTTTLAGGSSRRVRLVVARGDPWAVMKLSFLLSFALGIVGVVATAVVWLTLDGLHVFAKLNELVSTVAGPDSSGQVLSYFSFGKIVAGSMLVGVVDVFLLTAVATIAAFLYNIVAALVGGLHVTMTDD